MDTPSPRSRPRIAFDAGALVWPKLFQGARLALRPARIGLGVVVVVLAALLLRLPSMWVEGDVTPSSILASRGGEAASEMAKALAEMDFPAFIVGIATLFIGVPKQVCTAFPWSMLAIALPLAGVVAILGVAICRSAATEFAGIKREPWPAMLAFSLSRARSSIAALLVPGIIIGIVVLALAGAGWVAMGTGAMRWIGGVLYGLILLVGAVVAVFTLVYTLGLPLLLPAIACEGTDAIDGVQRACAYVIARPARLVAYAIIAIVVGIALGGVSFLVVTLVNSGTAWASTILVPEPADEIVRSLARGRTVAESLPPDASANLRFFARGIGFWVAIPTIIASGVLVSFFFSGSTVLYLLIRHWADGQHPGDLWFPGRIAGTLLPGSNETAPEGSAEDDDF